MKSTLKLSLLLGAAVAAMNLTALAGPGPQQVFRPLNSQQELSVLKPGTQVAHECPQCGTITVSKIGKDQSHATSHTCPECKMKVTFRDIPGGKVPKVGMLQCVDAKTGKAMSASVCAAHK